MILNVTLVLTPIPLSNIVPALVIAVISLAYLEEDGLLLSLGKMMRMITRMSPSDIELSPIASCDHFSGGSTRRVPQS